MAEIVKISDFVGEHLIVMSGYGTDNVQLIIDRHEDYYLSLLLGDTLKSELIADLDDGEPQSSEILEWYDPFCLTEDESYCIDLDRTVSRGFKDVLIGLIYYHIINDNLVTQGSQGGSTTNKVNENSLGGISQKREGEKRWNDSVLSWQVIATRLETNIDAITIQYLDWL